MQYDIESIQYFSKKEISDNIEEIKEAIKNNMTRYQRYEKLYELKIEESSFIQIFSSKSIMSIACSITISQNEKSYLSFYNIIRNNAKKVSNFVRNLFVNLMFLFNL